MFLQILLSLLVTEGHHEFYYEVYFVSFQSAEIASLKFPTAPKFWHYGGKYCISVKNDALAIDLKVLLQFYIRFYSLSCTVLILLVSILSRVFADIKFIWLSLEYHFFFFNFLIQKARTFLILCLPDESME